MKHLFLIIFITSTHCFSQTSSNQYGGFSAGVLFNFGTHVHSIGFSFKSYFTNHFFQINAGSTITYNPKSYGNRKNMWESRTYLGGIILGGIKDNSIDFQLDGLTHQTKFRNGIGFNYIWYYDNVGTTQLSGGWSLHIQKVGIYFENDVFGGQAKDRFRTGSLLVTYRYQQMKWGTGIYLWTGETDGAIWNRTISKKFPYGSKDLSQLPYGKTSHGILYSSAVYNLNYGQLAQLKIGIDSERFRDVIQNRIIHDLIFLPKNFERKTPHYPALNKDGMPIIDNNEIRKTKLFIQAGLNENEN